MTAPAQDSSSGQDRPRFRANQLVSFRTVLADVEREGHALVLRVLDDLAHLAVLGGAGGFLQVPVDHLSPAKVDEVPNPLPAPDAPADGSGQQ